MVPTSYTNATFREYLQKEILIDVADALSWVDRNPVPNPFIYQLTGSIPANGNILTLDTPLTHKIKVSDVGPFWTASDSSGSYSMIRDAQIGQKFISIPDSRIGVEASPHAAVTVNTKVFLYEDDTVFDAAPIYLAITDETLMLLGYALIGDVPAAYIEDLRMTGRIEAWRTVASHTCTDINTQTDVGNLSRSQLHEHAVEQMQLAEKDYAIFRPQLALTYSTSWGSKNAVASTDVKTVVEW